MREEWYRYGDSNPGPVAENNTKAARNELLNTISVNRVAGAVVPCRLR